MRRESHLNSVIGRRRCQNLSPPVALGRPHDTGVLHLLDQPRRPVVANPQTTLHVGNRGLAGLGDDRNGLIVERVGFGIFFTIGAVVTLTSMFSFSQLLTGNPVPFALKYSIGNVISLFSTAFIVGPARQLKGMTAPTRWLAALVYLGAIAGTLVSALVLDSGILVLVFIIVQFCAEVWYVLSYIPYGRRLCATCLQSAVGDV